MEMSKGSYHMRLQSRVAAAGVLSAFMNLACCAMRPTVSASRCQASSVSAALLSSHSPDAASHASCVAVLTRRVPRRSLLPARSGSVL